MIAAREDKYLIFGDIPVKWIWSEWELVEFRKMWNGEKSIHEIAKAFKTNKRSIALLVMDQAENDYIKQRRHGLF